MGAPKVLGEYYPDLRDERFETIGCFGHNRYSTNTWPSFKRVQPFSVLGHNGEINTIEQLRQEARMLGVPIQPGSSDSQDLNRTIDTLVSRDGPQPRRGDGDGACRRSSRRSARLPEELHRFYMYLHQAMGPFAQGPVALIARHADECVFSADALGLRPLWQVETERRLRLQLRARRRLGPRDGLRAEAARPRREGAGDDRPRAQALDPAPARRDAADRPRPLAGAQRRRGRRPPTTARSRPAARSRASDVPGYSDAGPEEPVKVADRVLAGFGWQRDDVKLVQQMASNGAEPIGSLGYDGPLAALSPERQNLADYFKETVAVVTNPAIDREREIEHFSTRAVFGRRPSIDAAGEDTGTVETAFPVILGGHHGMAPLSDKTYRRIAREHQHLPARGPLGGVPRPRRRGRHLAARVGDDPRARSSGSSRRR